MEWGTLGRRGFFASWPQVGVPLGLVTSTGVVRLIAERFGANPRYSGAGLGYQLASVIAGGPAPLIATKILQETGSSVGISWYIVGCCVAALLALVFLLPRAEAAGSTARSNA